MSMVVGSGVRHFTFGFQPILHVASLRTTFLQIDAVCLLGHLVLRRLSFGFIFGCVFVYVHRGPPVIFSMGLSSTLSDRVSAMLSAGVFLSHPVAPALAALLLCSIAPGDCPGRG